jgi:anti-sigma regulatory factor (Ser/Thr protein kinase)
MLAEGTDFCETWARVKGVPMHRRQPGESAHPRFECELPATNRSLGILRSRFAEWLHRLPEPRADRIDLVLALSELAAAAVRGNESMSKTKNFVAYAWLEDGAVAIQVLAPQPPVRREASDAERGFAIVASITDALSVRALGDRTLVSARKW